MRCDVHIKCRLNELMRKKNITPERLAMASGVPVKRIDQYRNNQLESVSIPEIASIMIVLECTSIDELIDMSLQDDVLDYPCNDPVLRESEWESPCVHSTDRKHKWFKDMRVSDSVYQEFVCRECKQRLGVIL